MSWEVVTIEGVTHVLPLNDSEEHTTELEWRGMMHGCFCKCGVRFEFEGDKTIAIHSSFDGREGIEWTEAILSGK